MNHYEGGTTVVQKRMSFISVTVMCVSGVLITVIACASGLAIYGLRIVDRKTDSAFGLIHEAVRQLPELQKSLPPALADAINDERRPDYIEQLDVNVRIMKTDSRGLGQAVVEVVNKGDEVVSLLSLRVLGMNEDGDPIVEENSWAATPLQMDRDWRGPIMPNETRRFPVRFYCREKLDSAKYEITEVRVWRGPDKPETLAKAI